jgi:hypothetical protein
LILQNTSNSIGWFELSLIKTTGIERLMVKELIYLQN